MISNEDRTELATATELLLRVIDRHRGEDLRAVSLLTAAIGDIRVGERYLRAHLSRTAAAS